MGFREALCAQAQRAGVSGWVRNRRDGSVEAMLQGAPDAVESVITWARHGPPAARVTQVEVSPACGEFDRPHAGFKRLPSA